MRRCDRAKARQGSSVPIPLDHVPYLENLGAELERIRRLYRLTRVAVADGAYLGRTHIWRIERGLRRTRPSTLTRIVNAMFELIDEDDQPSFDVAGTVAHLIDLAGPALAEDPPNPERTERRAARRQQRRFQQRQENPPWWTC